MLFLLSLTSHVSCLIGTSQTCRGLRTCFKVFLPQSVVTFGSAAGYFVMLQNRSCPTFEAAQLCLLSWGCNHVMYTMGFPGGSDGKESACNAGDQGLILGSGSSLEMEMATSSAPRRDSAEPRPRGCSGLGEPRPALPSF